MRTPSQEVLPGQLPEGEQNAEFVVQLLELIKSAEDELRLSVTFPLEPHHVRLQGGESHVHS